jgi:hypothetical protein
LIKKITTREQLIEALHTAAELEHDLMCQYLFAAYSMKRSTAEGGIDAVQLEQIRRWGSLITSVARQEMEHMGLVLNMLSAIGGTPYFTRPNFPQKTSYYGRADIELTLTRFNTDTIKRFQFFEQPHPAPEAGWCQRAQGSAAGSVRTQVRAGTLTTENLQAAALDQADIRFSSVQDLYLKILEGFVNVTRKIGEASLFTGSAKEQVWGGPGSTYEGSMDDLNQYDMDFIPVTNLQSASNAVFIILEQGEGVSVLSNYVEHTHYCIFTNMLDGMKKEGFETEGSLEAARPVVSNPMTVIHPHTRKREVNLITNTDAREVAELFNNCYELMLLMMMFLYSNNNKTAQQATSLMNAIFFPLMTMFIRPLSEVLTLMPAFTDKPGNAGPGFELSTDVLLLPPPDYAWKIFQERLDDLARDFARLSILKKQQEYPALVERLSYMSENMAHLAKDWRKNWKNIGRSK